jgi:transposase
MTLISEVFMTPKRKYKRYLKESKEEVVALIRELGYCLAQATESVGVSAALPGKWKKILKKTPAFFAREMK